MNASTKCCTQCGTEYPPTAEYFYFRNRKPISRCKQCVKQSTAQYTDKYPEKRREYQRKSRAKQRKNNPEKAREYDKQSRTRHRERRIQNNKEWKDHHKEHVKQYGREYGRAHPRQKSEAEQKHQREVAKKRYDENPDMLRERSRQYYWNNREKCSARARQYRVTHPESKRIAEAKRRALKKASGGTYTTTDMQRQYKSQAGKCYYCQGKLKKFHIEHVVPLSRGGSHDPSNIVLSCPRCNSKKKDKLPHEWPEGGRLL